MKSVEPNQAARKAMMSVARSKKNPNNSFFIDRATGAIKTAAYRDEKGYFPEIPKGTYEVHIRKCPFCSYSDLQDQIDAIMCNVWQEDAIEEENQKLIS
jgi:hypothetical protein